MELGNEHVKRAATWVSVAQALGNARRSCPIGAGFAGRPRTQAVLCEQTALLTLCRATPEDDRPADLASANLTLPSGEVLNVGGSRK